MSVFRVQKNKNYTIMSNYHLKEKEMSLKAKGLLSLMLSLPDDWDYTVAGLISLCKENETAITTALKELETFGYLKRKRIQNAKGQFDYDYSIFEEPHLDNPCVGKPYQENLCTENQGQLITNKQITKKQNTNIEKKYIGEKQELLKNKVANIVDYLNKTAHTNFKQDSKETIRLINARLKEGYVEADFYKVIDNKWAEWQNTEFQQYVRPCTLFGNKFENYLNATRFNGKPKISYSSVDNTAGHFTGNEKISDGEFSKMEFDKQKEYVSNMALKDMTPLQRNFFEEYCLARDENGNLLKF